LQIGSGTNLIHYVYEKWYELTGENTIVDTIMERVVNGANRIELDGDSMRKNRKTNK